MITGNIAIDVASIEWLTVIIACTNIIILGVILIGLCFLIPGTGKRR